MYSSIVPQKQTLRQGFMCKLLIKEVLPRETNKRVEGAGQRRLEAKQGMIPDLVLWRAWNVNYTLEFLSSQGKGVGCHPARDCQLSSLPGSLRL